MVRQGRSWSGYERNCAFLNLGDQAERFANISAVSGLDFDDDARAIAVLDWDHDGDLDLWIRNRNAPQLRLMRNEAGRGAGGFLRIRLNGDGKTTNRDAIGARVEVSLKGTTHRLIRTIRAGEGFLSQSSKTLHFGLGPAQAADIEQVVIHWPTIEGKTEEILTGLEPNRTYLVEQGQGQRVLEGNPGASSALKPLPIKLPQEESVTRVLLESLLPSPEITYRSREGESMVMPLKQDDWSLVNLWASWCAPCQDELKEFAERADELKAAKIQVLALSVEAANRFSVDSPDVVKAGKLVAQFGLPFATGFAEAPLLDKFQSVNDFLTTIHRPLPVPTSFLINPRNQIVAIYKGRVSVDTVLEDAMDSPLHERLQRAMQLGGSLVPSETVREAAVFREAEFQLHAGRDIGAKSPMTAAAFFTESLRHRPASGEGRILLATSLAASNQIEAAQSHLMTVLGDPTAKEHHAAATYLLSMIALQQNQIGQAMEQLEATLQLQPDHVHALNNLATLLIARSQQIERAIELSDRAVNLTGGNQPEYLATQGKAYAKAGNFDEAISAIEKAMALAEGSGNQSLVSTLRAQIALYREQADRLQPSVK